MTEYALTRISSFFLLGGKMARKSSVQRKKQRAEESENLSKRSSVHCINEEQKKALEIMQNNTISFITGKAGTGKTHIAVAYAVSEFINKKYDKIIMTRPAVEAGEKLGYLPGELENKIHPFMIPLFDFLEELLDKKYIERCFEEGIFEILPISYMRGRNLKSSIIIIDEAQNAKKEQILLLVTRICDGSKIIVTGDPKQSDINGKGKLEQISKKLSEIDSIDHIELKESVRHPLINKIIDKFDEID